MSLLILACLLCSPVLGTASSYKACLVKTELNIISSLPTVGLTRETCWEVPVMPLSSRGKIPCQSISKFKIICTHVRVTEYYVHVFV